MTEDSQLTYSLCECLLEYLKETLQPHYSNSRLFSVLRHLFFLENDDDPIVHLSHALVHHILWTLPLGPNARDTLANLATQQSISQAESEFWYRALALVPFYPPGHLLTRDVVLCHLAASAMDALIAEHGPCLATDLAEALDITPSVALQTGTEVRQDVYDNTIEAVLDRLFPPDPVLRGARARHLLIAIDPSRRVQAQAPPAVVPTLPPEPTNTETLSRGRPPASRGVTPPPQDDPMAHLGVEELMSRYTMRDLNTWLKRHYGRTERNKRAVAEAIVLLRQQLLL